MHTPAFRLAALAGLATLLVASIAPAHGFVDVLDQPAATSALASQRLLLATAVAGKRLVAAGARGHIIFSDDLGRSWQQAKVPVSADLTALHFVDAKSGWAVGHEGVVLHTRDGGATWTLQLDGRRANKLVLDRVQHLPAGTDPTVLEALKSEADRAMSDGPSRPFLDVWFANAREGYVVGAYNLIFHTRDGGESWEPWVDRTENPRFYHLYGIRGGSDGVYVAGELGLMLHLDPATGRFAAVQTPYEGSYFGLLTKPGLVLAYGMRGTAYRSRDGGAHWEQVDTGITASITGSQVLPDGRLLLCSQAGDVLVSDDDGVHFRRVATKQPMPYTGLAVEGDVLVLSGLRGVRVESIRLPR
ncbi:YCF48-related protein [Lysobacter sp. KIS68-7]|uniref:WD40/YVTN/BNR-like repeat-containing protein n=1 Tax=Lysobacter sp. KIS68-7 TaxID=2904252 RepID=UPI001E2B6BDF|nr:YCF48-related protein [Lysobacter sp. KIS68-7]UHQ20039.1 YCF48-related protein [Lysobacter sp. KIS68-7]